MSKQQNPKDTRKSARKWDPYFKKSNVKKLKNLLADALRKGLTTVTIPNRNKEGKIESTRTLTLFELEQLIKSKEQESFVKHYLSSTKPEDIVPWYKDIIELSLMYKDIDDNRYVDTTYASLTSNQTEYIFNTNPSLEKYSTVSYTHIIMGSDKTFHDLDYQINVQKYPSNNVFVNKSGELDVFTYNVSYLYVGERLHNAKSNNSINDFVPFVTNYKVSGKKVSYFTIDEVAKNSFISKIPDLNNKTGLIYEGGEEDTYMLSYVKYINGNDNPILTYSKTVKTAENGEMWGFDGSQVYIVPQYSSNSNADKKNIEISTAYSQLGVVFLGSNCKTNHIQIDPYISGEGWYIVDPSKEQPSEYKTVVKQYEKILKTKIDEDGHLSGDKLKGDIYVYTHPITCSIDAFTTLSPSEQQDPNIDVEYTYLSDKMTLTVTDSSLSKCILYTYTIDESPEHIYGFENYKYTYTYRKTNESPEYKVNLCKYQISYELSTIPENEEDTSVVIANNTVNKNVISFQAEENKVWDKEYLLTTNSSLINPLTNTKILLSDGNTTDLDLTFKFVPKSYPYLNVKNLNMTSETIGNKNINLKLDFNYDGTIITNSCYFVDSSYIDSSPVYMFTENNGNITYNNTIKLNSCLFVYSYIFGDSGIVEHIDDSVEHETRTYDVSLSNGVDVQYSYVQTTDMIKLTKPTVYILSEPEYTVTYIGDKAIVHILSDDFNIWSDNIYPFNTKDDTLYLVKNSYIVRDSSIETPLSFTYQHKSEDITHTLKIATTNEVTKTTYAYTGIQYNFEDTGISTHWNYNFDILQESRNNTSIFKYNNIELVSEDENVIKLNCNSIDELIYTAIPNAVFKALYDRLGVDNVNCGFVSTEGETQLEYPFVEDEPQTMTAKFLFKPIFGISNPCNIKLDTITNLILVNGEPYPLQSEYYIVQIPNNGEYYLYCIFETPTGQQVLPPLVYHINMFSDSNKLNDTDYEFYTINNQAVKVELTHPSNIKNTYMLYGFDKEITTNVETNSNYAKSNYADNVQTDSKKETFNIKDDSSDITYCVLTCYYAFDNNSKLKDFTKETSRESYTYIYKYTGFISDNSGIDNETHTFSSNRTITTAQKSIKSELVTYITTEFNDGNTERGHVVQPIFRFGNKSNKLVKDQIEIIDNTETFKYTYVVTPSIISNYPSYEMPQLNQETGMYDPITESFTPVYDTTV